MKDIGNEVILRYLNEMSVNHHLGNDVSIVPLAESGSDRRYFRIRTSDGDFSCIATYVPDAAEGKCFVSLAGCFKSLGGCVPEILDVSDDFHFYLQEDLGDVSLFSTLDSDFGSGLVKDTLQRLVALQKMPYGDWHGLAMAKDFNLRQVMWDLNYFKYDYLKPRNVIFDEDAIEDDFQLLASRLLSIDGKFMGFMMRDCQSRNVMVTESGPVFIDFQGGRRGPVLYDAVSFLWQARAGFSDEFRTEMLDYYADTYCSGNVKQKEDMLSSLDEIVLFRTLQVLGAYGFRGLVQNKSHFLMSIPGALSNLARLVEKGVLDDYPELKKVSKALISDSLFDVTPSSGRLDVEIFSFSYKKGYPKDFSGNGGGFVFDCRALHNPGRYKEYKQLTGRDKPVVDFLEERGEIQAFLKSAWSLTDAAVERYVARGFSHLQIAFGCTGGRHRSVYSAEHTAAHIRSLFPDVNVILTHRENPAK